MPYQQNLDLDGSLPFGSYRTLTDKQFDPKRTCLLTAGLSFWNVVKDKNAIDTQLAIQNAQKLIDSGLTTFQLNIPPCDLVNKPQGSFQSGMETNAEQGWVEQNIYHKLVRETPPSVLALCNLGTKISVPYWDYEGNIGNGSMVRQKVGESILNIHGNAGGCIDSIQVDFRAGRKNTSTSPETEHKQSSSSSTSPYTFDVLDTLFDMQREGLIRSIHGVNFPSAALEEIGKVGFHFDTNQVSCDLLNPNDYFGSRGMQKFCRDSERDDGKGKGNGKPMKVVMSSPLAGGLLTNKYSEIPDQYRNRSGEPPPEYMSSSEEWHYNKSLKGTWRVNYGEKEGQIIERNRAWRQYEQHVMRTMYEISLKHRVDIASVALRWAMQQDHVGSISVGSSLNTRFGEEVPFTRPRDLRKAFSLHLDDDDMERLLRISGAKLQSSYQDEWGNEYEKIDLSNKQLWL